MHKKRVFVRFLLVFVVVAAAAGGVWWFFLRSEEKPTQLTLYGNIEIRQVAAAFWASERVTQMLAEEGDTVTRGQLLGMVDKYRLRAAANRTAAQVRSQEQVLQRLETGSRPQEIHKARADLAAAEAQAEDAQITYQRMQSAVQAQAVSEQAADNAQAQNEVAQATLKSARQSLSLAVEGPRQEDIESASATLAAYRADLAIAQQNLADANLYSPADAIIQDRLLEPGDMASPQVPAYLLALTDPVWVRVFVSETDLGKIKPGMPGVVRTDSFPDKRYPAWVGYISPTAEFTPKTVETPDLRTSLVYQVRVYVKNAQNELRLGMPVTVTVDLDNKADE